MGSQELNDELVCADQLINLGLAYRNTGDFQEALSHLSKAERILQRHTVPSERMALVATQIREVREIIRERQRLSPWERELETYKDRFAYEYGRDEGKFSEFHRFYYRGNDLARQGNHQSAIQAFTSAIRLIPYFALAFYNRGNSYFALQRWDKAIEDYTRSIDLFDRYPKVYNNRGICYYRRGMHTRAAGDFHRAIELDPDFRDAHRNLGILRGQGFIRW